MASSVRIVEVGPRDGLQNIQGYLPAGNKADLINSLHRTGLQTIELTSAVSPEAVPQLRDCSQVLEERSVRDLLGSGHGRYPVLVPNLKGLSVAQRHGVKDIAVFISATEEFSKANTNRSIVQGIAASSEVAQAAIHENITVRGYLSCVFADPFEGPTPHSAVLRGVKALLEMGCYEVSLGDTLGIGTPHQVRKMIEFLRRNGVPMSQLAGHFHDTHGEALANVWEAYLCGLRVFDSSIAGLGGCPFAPGAKGNVATEDVVCMFHHCGIETGVDLAQLAQVGAWISNVLGRANGSRAGPALINKAGLPVVSEVSTRQTQSQNDSQRTNREAQQALEGVGYVRNGQEARIEQISRDLRVMVVRGRSQEILEDLAVNQEMKAHNSSGNSKL